MKMIIVTNHVCARIRTSVEDANFQREGDGGVSNDFIDITLSGSICVY